MAIYDYTEVLKDGNIEYPDRCVECGKQTPDTTYKINTWGLWRKPANEPLFKYFTVYIPACSCCHHKISKELLKSTFVSLLIYGIAGLTCLLFLVLTEFSEGYLIPLAIFSIMLSSWVIDLICHPAVTVMPYQKWLRFHYRDDDYGKDFYKLNCFKC